MCGGWKADPLLFLRQTEYLAARLEDALAMHYYNFVAAVSLSLVLVSDSAALRSRLYHYQVLQRCLHLG